MLLLKKACVVDAAFDSNFMGKYLPNMNKFCDCLSETKVIIGR